MSFAGAFVTEPKRLRTLGISRGGYQERSVQKAALCKETQTLANLNAINCGDFLLALLAPEVGPLDQPKLSEIDQIQFWQTRARLRRSHGAGENIRRVHRGQHTKTFLF